VVHVALTEHLHAVLGNCELIPDDADVPKAEGFHQGLDDLAMWDRTVRSRSHRSGNQSQLFTSQLFS
jgi:hypothetical protein